MAHHGQHRVCEACDRAAGFSGARWEVAALPDGAVRVDRIWWERGVCCRTFRADPDGAVYDCLFAPHRIVRIDAGAPGYVSRDDRIWADLVAEVAKRPLVSGQAEQEAFEVDGRTIYVAVYRDSANEG